MSKTRGITAKPKGKGDERAELAAKIDETDEMKLKLLASLDNPDPEDMLYPPELNAHLLEQLKMMTGENNDLRKLTFTKDLHIKELTKTVSDLNQRIRDIISGTGPAISSKSAGIISAKITELCKQNRHLVSEVESFKTKNASLERKIIQMDIMNKENEKLDTCVCKDQPIELNPDELKELNSKLAVVNKKLYDSKNRNLELKNDILIATKILQQELGDKFTSIKELQNDVAGWKGRAQQIISLQARITELEGKLANKNNSVEGKKIKDQNQIIRDLEIKRKKETEQAMKEYQALRTENQELKKKLEGAKSRIKNLECDAVLIRQKMQTFADKSNHDDLLINEQRNQIKTLEKHYQEILKENTIKMNKMKMEMVEFQKQVDNTDAKIEAMKKQAHEKSTKIEELRVQLCRYEECSLQSVFFTPMKTATDNEIKSLSEMVVTLNERLTEERQKYDELENSHRKLKEKKRRLERQINSLEEEIKSQSNNNKKASRFYRSSSSFSQMSITKKQSSTSGASMGENEAIPEHETESSSTLQSDDLKYKLELAEEKLKIMEEKLKMLQEEKCEDFRRLTDMIQTSKQLFNEALVVLQKRKETFDL